MVQTTKYQGKDYATVPARLKEFREQNPNAAIDTNPTYHEDGSVTFKAKIVKDRKDEHSAVASGNAHYSADEMKPKKSFEKLETIAVGRALANLGYLNDGQIASTEEMEDFYSYKQTKVEEAVDLLESAETLDELRSSFMKLGTLMKDKAVIEAKDKMKARLAKVAV